MTGTERAASAAAPIVKQQPTAANAIPANNRHNQAAHITPIQPTTLSPDKPFARLPPQCQGWCKENPATERNLLASRWLQTHPLACCLSWTTGASTVWGR